MADYNSEHQYGQQMLDLFASVGATSFDVTQTTHAGSKEWFRRGVGLTELRRLLPAMIDQASARQHNVIVRPHGSGVTFIQLDDLKYERLAALAFAAFLTLETSPGNFQAWVAMAALPDKDFARRLRKGAGADPTASGATRIAGSLNFKAKYAAAGFPRVAIRQAKPGLVTNAAALDDLGLVAAPETTPPTLPPARVSRGGASRRWPSYAVCLDGAPLNSEETGPDVSRADFVFCMTAITWGWSVQETAERLMEESTKAKSQGKAYAELTTRNAALAVERRRQQPKRQFV